MLGSPDRGEGDARGMGLIAVVGAAGKTGRAVMAALRARGERPRGLVRRDPTVDEVTVDLLDPDSVRAALDGVGTVYHLAPNVHPEEQRIGRTVLDAARAAGATRFVFHSVLHPQVESMPHHWAKLRVEEMVVESGMEWTVLQPAAYVQNFARPADGVLRAPYSLDAPFSLVDVTDVAEAAATVLTAAGHTAATYELAGPRPVTVRQVAAALGVRAEQQAVDEWARGQRLPTYALEALSAMFGHYDRHGLVGNPRVLATLLGRVPHDPLDVLARNATDPHGSG